MVLIAIGVVYYVIAQYTSKSWRSSRNTSAAFREEKSTKQNFSAAEGVETETYSVHQQRSGEKVMKIDGDTEGQRR